MPLSRMVSKDHLLGRLPGPWPEDLRPRIHEAVLTSGRKLVVLDDDPTGTQTVHGIPVLTHWSAEALRQELRSDIPAFYIQTNSRSLPLQQAQGIAAEIGARLQAAAQETGRRFAVVSRSDSTLRGHFPGEVAALAASLVRTMDGWILCPFFEEGGRYTVGDVHYVQEGEALIPAGETDFAGDAAFGYRSSNLRQWVEEKSAGTIRLADVLSVSIEDIRKGGPARVQEILSSVKDETVCVVNAAAYRDLEVFVLGLLAAEAGGRNFIYRTAASFVQVRAGLWPKALLTASELKLSGASGGLSIVGSYVRKTTEQLQRLISARPDIVALELDVARLLEGPSSSSIIEQAANRVEAALRTGRDVVVYTSRAYLSRPTAAAGLADGNTISQGLVSILKKIRIRPRYVLAKGGITAADVAVDGLKVKRAMVAGQIIPGVPVWELGPESLFPRCPLVVFPGNVGDAGALLRVVEVLGRS